MRYIATFFIMAALIFVTGCGKNTAKTTPAEEVAPSLPAPTAQISVTPTSVNPGDKVTLSWSTTNASNVTISGFGNVGISGQKTLTVENSTSYHLEARNDSGSATADARLTVTDSTSTNNEDSAPIYSMTEEQEFKSNMKDIFFDYDHYAVSKTDEEVMVQNAAYLRKHPNLKIVIGGYCDERGSNEYNLALGQNRAESAQKMLVAAGIKSDRMRVISFGKEKPFCTQSTESCWQQNRRAGFALAR
jgi:peptidoglycan-associated lipoprotein